jgi:2-phosphosulfolactate phosphatase
VFRQEDAQTDGIGAAAVIDTLRATTTITAILERGALAVRPVADLKTAYAQKTRDPDILLGGERNNRPPEGFDGGNSPHDWPKERVIGRRVAFTTTNGTQAIERVRKIPRLVLAALINAEACARYLWHLQEPTLLVASGSRGAPALEDVLAAGAVAHYWPHADRTDAAEIACTVFERNRARLSEAVRLSDHGRDLDQMGLAEDLTFAARLDVSMVVPILDADGWLRALKHTN